MRPASPPVLCRRPCTVRVEDPRTFESTRTGHRRRRTCIRREAWWLTEQAAIIVTMPGTLFVVATPIGNLEDLSFRALRTLREVDLIAAEDTRRTSKLLAHYEIRKSLVSLHEHNEHREAPRLAARLEQGESIALVTDAGTPGVSDPGAHLVRL